MFSDKVFFFIQALLRYFPFKLGLVLRRFLYKPFFKHFGKNISIHDGVIIKYPSEIVLENNITFNQYCFIVGKGGLKIGSDTLIGAGSKIVTTTHSYNSRSVPISKQAITSDTITIK